MVVGILLGIPSGLPSVVLYSGIPSRVPSEDPKESFFGDFSRFFFRKFLPHTPRSFFFSDIPEETPSEIPPRVHSGITQKFEVLNPQEILSNLLLEIVEMFPGVPFEISLVIFGISLNVFFFFSGISSRIYWRNVILEGIFKENPEATLGEVPYKTAVC